MVPILHNQVTIYCGDCREVLRQLPAGSIHTCVTSPPYWGLRDYGVDGQLGHEVVHDCLGWAGGNACGECYVCHLVAVFAEVHRVLRNDGTLWLNLGDTYAGYWGKKYAHKAFGQDRTPDGSTPPNKPSPDFGRLRIKPKDLIGVPWRVALALQAAGWYLRSEVIWAKRNPMPQSAGDRPSRSHEHVFLLSKSRRYFYDAEAIREPLAKANAQRSTAHYNTADRYGAGNGGNTGLDRVAARMRSGEHGGRNKRTVWTLSTRPFKGAHFAVFPPELITPCILAGTSAAGCCSRCGAPYQRMLERQRVPTRPGRETKIAGRNAGEIGNRDPRRHVTHTQTLGWQPSCNCERSEAVACTVLDPFLGSGTTAAVAERLGCHCIGIELNETYCRLAADRFRQGNFLTRVRFGACGTPAGRTPAEVADAAREADR